MVECHSYVDASVLLLYTCSWIEDAGGVPGVCWTANSLKVTFATENKTRKWRFIFYSIWKQYCNESRLEITAKHIRSDGNTWAALLLTVSVPRENTCHNSVNTAVSIKFLAKNLIRRRRTVRLRYSCYRDWKVSPVGMVILKHHTQKTYNSCSNL